MFSDEIIFGLMLSFVKLPVEMYETLLNLILIWKAMKENALTNQS